MKIFTSGSLNSKTKYFLMSFYSYMLKIFFYIKLEKSFFLWNGIYIKKCNIY